MALRLKKIGAPAKSLKKENGKTGQRKKRESLTNRMSFKLLCAVFGLLVIFFTALVLILSKSIKRDSIKSYTELTIATAEGNSSSMTYWLSSYFKDLRVFTKNSVFLEGNIDDTREFMEDNHRLIGEDFDFVGIADMGGNFVTTNGQEFNVMGMEFFSAISNKGLGEFLSSPVQAATGDWFFYTAVPAVDKNGTMFGVFAGAIPLKIIQKEIQKIKLGDNGFPFIIGANGEIIAHPDPSKIMANPMTTDEKSLGLSGIKQHISQMVQGKSGTGLITSGGTTSYIFYCPIDGTKWSLVLAIPEDEVLESARKNGLNIAGCSAVIALLLLIIINIDLNILLKPLTVLKDSISEIATGDADLTKKLKIKSKDEVGAVVEGFNLFVENLRTIISEIKESKDILRTIDKSLQQTTDETSGSISEISQNIDTVVTQIESQGESVDGTASAVTQIAKNIENLNRLIESQVGAVGEASSAIGQMLQNIDTVSSSMEKMAEAFGNLERFTKNGIEKQNAVNEQIAKIDEQSQMLFTANKTISKIASETNLLAMNAAIEAAHAGFAGAGFSVVADEIRTLSETSAQQSKSIGAELKKIQQSIERVVQSSGEAKEAFSSVSENIQKTDELVRHIKAAMEESARGSKLVTNALLVVNESSRDVKTSSKEMSEGNQSILAEIHRLQDATTLIRRSMETMGGSVRQIDKNGSTLTEISGTMQNSISQIGKQIDMFKV